MHQLSVYETDQYDPTQTTILRNIFARELERHLTELTKDIRTAIVDEDVFGLDHAFDSSRTSGKITAFLDWLQNKVEAGLLNPRIAWYENHVRAAYQWGIRRGRKELVTAGYTVPRIDPKDGISIIMAQPEHEDKLELLTNRVYQELKGIAAYIYQQASRVLMEGITAGLKPKELAEKLIAEIENKKNVITIHEEIQVNARTAKLRGDVLARTEVIRAHHIAMIQEYRNWGVAGVSVDVEWTTAGDDRVCDACASLSGKIFTLDEIENMIPYHPLCRCVALPLIAKTGWTAAGTFKSAITQFKKYGFKVILPVPNLQQLNIVGDAIGNEIYGQFPLVFGRMQAAKLADINIRILSTDYVRKMGKLVATYNITPFKKRQFTFGQKIFSLQPAPFKGMPRFTGPVDARYAVRHEFGHAIYYAGMKKAERLQFKKFFKDNRIQFVKKVSIYSSTNDAEAFAEAFAIYTDPRYGTSAEYQLPAVIEKTIAKLVGTKVVPGTVLKAPKLKGIKPITPRGTFGIVEPFLNITEMEWVPATNVKEGVNQLKKYGFKGVVVSSKEAAKTQVDEITGEIVTCPPLTNEIKLAHINRIGETIGTKILAQYPEIFDRMKETIDSQFGLTFNLGRRLVLKIFDGWDIRESGLFGNYVRAFFDYNTNTLGVGYNASANPDLTDEVLHIGAGRQFVANGGGATIRHEFAHIYRLNLSAPLFEYWSEAYKKIGKKTWSKVSILAATNADEGFSEAFTAFTSESYRTVPHTRLPVEVETAIGYLVGYRKAPPILGKPLLPEAFKDVEDMIWKKASTIAEARAQLRKYNIEDLVLTKYGKLFATDPITGEKILAPPLTKELQLEYLNMIGEAYGTQVLSRYEQVFSHIKEISKPWARPSVPSTGLDLEETYRHLGRLKLKLWRGWTFNLDGEAQAAWIGRNLELNFTYSSIWNRPFIGDDLFIDHVSPSSALDWRRRLFRSHASEDSGSIVRHEIGHAYMDSLTWREVRAWDEFYHTTSRVEDRNIWSRIGKNALADEHEGWAHVFAIYTHPLYGTSPERTLPKIIHDKMVELVGLPRSVPPSTTGTPVSIELLKPFSSMENMKWTPAKTIVEAKKQLRKFNITRIRTTSKNSLLFEYNPTTGDFDPVPGFTDEVKLRALNTIGEVFGDVFSQFDDVFNKFQDVIQNPSKLFFPTMEKFTVRLHKGWDMVFAGDDLTVSRAYWIPDMSSLIGVKSGGFGFGYNAVANLEALKKNVLYIEHGPIDLDDIKRYSIGGAEDARYAIRHELGHCFNDLLTTEQEQVWINFYDRTKSRFPDMWARLGKTANSNAREAFAETFAAWTSPIYGTSPETTLPERIEQVAQIIFGPRKPLLKP